MKALLLLCIFSFSTYALNPPVVSVDFIDGGYSRQTEVVKLTQDEFEKLKTILEEVRTNDPASWNIGECSEVSYWLSMILASEGIPSSLISTAGSDLWGGWGYHVALIFMVEGESKPIVLDTLDVGPYGNRRFDGYLIEFEEFVAKTILSEIYGAAPFWARTNFQFSMMEFNHYCSVFHKNYDGGPIELDSMSSRVIEIYQNLLERNLIFDPETPLTCESQGLEWL